MASMPSHKTLVRGRPYWQALWKILESRWRNSSAFEDTLGGQQFIENHVLANCANQK